MTLPSVALMHLHCGELHFYDYGALQLALTTLAGRPDTQGESLGVEVTTDRDQTHAKEIPASFDGFSIEQWATYAKLKARIATSVCKENARLKKLANFESREGVKGDSRHLIDPIFEADPWRVPRDTREQVQVLPRSTCHRVFDSGDAWAKWRGTDSDTPSERECLAQDVSDIGLPDLPEVVESVGLPTDDAKNVQDDQLVKMATFFDMAEGVEEEDLNEVCPYRDADASIVCAVPMKSTCPASIDQLADLAKQMEEIRKDMLKPQDVENAIGLDVKAGFESTAKDVHTLRHVRFEKI